MVRRNRVFPLVILREIRRSPGRFASIFLIVMLGSAFYAGMRAVRPDMEKTCDAYLDAQHCEDIGLVSAIGFTPVELARIARLPDVERVSGAYRFDAIMTPPGGKDAEGVPVAILSIPNRPSDTDIDAPRLVEGRLPERSGECLAETGQAGRRPSKVGERIRLASKYGSRDFLVTGIAQSPLFISFERGSNSLGSGTTKAYYLVLEDDAYDLALPRVDWPAGFSTSRFYTDARITLKGAAALDTFGRDYAALVTRAKAEIRGLAESTLGSDRYWFVSGRMDNAGIRGFSSDSERVGNLGMVFPLVFFLVAALVCLTAMTRLIEEKRGEIGVLKALGRDSRSIVALYFFYAAAATLSGGLIGTLIGFPVFPALIYSMYRLMYDVGPLRTFFIPSLALESIFFAFVCTAGATAVAGLKELVSVPSVLMRPRAPVPGKRVFLERFPALWRRLDFFRKVTARNLFRYKRRFWMSVAGIAGCTALLVAGFGMNDSLSALTSRQFGEIYHYDALVTFSPDSPTVVRNGQSILDRVRANHAVAKVETISIQGCTLGSPGSSRIVDGFLLVPERPDYLGDYITLRDGKKRLSLGPSDVVLTRKAAQLLGLAKGDVLEIDVAGKVARFTVSAVTDQYVMHFAYLSPAAYARAFGTVPAYNQIALVEKPASSPEEKKVSESALGRDLLTGPGILRVSFTSADTKLWTDTMDTMRYIIAVIVIAAGLLSFVVIYTLTSINITERRKELATIRVLGFREGEVARYVYRENAVLAVIGIAVGLALGSLLHRSVVLTTEVDVCMFGRSVEPLSYVFSAALGALFALAANLIMFGRIRRIDMVVAMKGAE